MAYPPTIPAADITNNTAQVDRHPADHNAITNGLRDIVNELGTNPSGSYTTVTAALATTAWTPLVAVGGWIPFAGMQNTQYRKVGDVVELRGAFSSNDKAANTWYAFGTMPVGFWPPLTVSLAGSMMWTTATPSVMEISSVDGAVRVFTTQAFAANQIVFSFLGSWSVTA